MDRRSRTRSESEEFNWVRVELLDREEIAREGDKNDKNRGLIDWVRVFPSGFRVGRGTGEVGST